MIAAVSQDAIRPRLEVDRPLQHLNRSDRNIYIFFSFVFYTEISFHNNEKKSRFSKVSRDIEPRPGL